MNEKLNEPLKIIDEWNECMKLVTNWMNEMNPPMSGIKVMDY